MTNPLETFLSAYLRYPAFRPFCACILFHADLIILYASDLKGGFTHVLVVDGDEFWHPAELHRSLCLVANVARQTIQLGIIPEHVEVEIREALLGAVANVQT